MTRVRIACIVEGHGDARAVPLLIRRIASQLSPGLHVNIPSPIRQPRNRLVRDGELERAIELAARSIGRDGGILVLIDGDDDLPCQLGPQLLARARQAHRDLPISVVVAKREYEAWFLAATESLRGAHRLPQNLPSPPDPESIRGAKEWLTRHMPAGNRTAKPLINPRSLPSST